MVYRKHTNFDLPYYKKPSNSYGIEEEMSLQSIQYATTLNTYINERIEAENHESD